MTWDTASLPANPRRGSCRSCGAAIYWALTGSGTSMPVDIEPVAGGNVRFVGPARVEVLGPIEVELEDGPLFVSHFATCPHADEHRRRT